MSLLNGGGSLVLPASLVMPENISIFTQVVFGGCSNFVAVRMLLEKGGKVAKARFPFFEVDANLEDRIIEETHRADQTGLAMCVVPGTVLAPGSARAEDVVQMQVVLVDLDDGDIAAKRDHLEKQIGSPTLVVASGGVTDEGQRKLHIYWRLNQPAEREGVALVARLRSMIATKVGGDKSFASVPQPIRVAGSVYQKGGHYRPVEILHYDETREYELGALSEAVMVMPAMPGEPPAVETKGVVTALCGKKIREGGIDGINRHDAITQVTGRSIRRCREGRITRDEAWGEVTSYNAEWLDPPFPEARLKGDFERLWKLDIERNGDMPPEGHLAAIPLSQDALADTFTSENAGKWRYVAQWDQWYIWTGAVWRRDETRCVENEARGVCRAAAQRAGDMALGVSSAATVSAVLRLARTDRRHAATTDLWDRDLWLLNTPKGVLDLRTGETRSHDPILYMTKMAGASAEGDCPNWLTFLKTVTAGDPDLQAYLRRVAGYLLTGTTGEHALFFLYGTGANGKSVFIETIQAIMGDYATVAPMDTFMASRSDRHPTDLAGFRGARLVAASETEEGSRWAESKLKAMTGGDKITARFMRQDFFEYVPQFKLLIGGNHKPSIRNLDEAMRRRLHMVPFTVTIPPERRDKQLSARLLEERDGILAWAVQGCLEWQKLGLCPPQAVLAATTDYFEAEDAIGRWIGERCDLGPSYTATSAMLFDDWKRWAEVNGEYAGAQKRLSEALRLRGFERNDTRLARGFRGIRLRPPSVG